MAQAQLNSPIIFSKEQSEVLNGAMLGDGCLYLHKNGINAQFIYQSKSKQHTEFVGNFFKQYWSGEGLKESSYFDERTKKEYFFTRIKTYTNISFTEQYNKWYINGIKHIPKDLILTPLTCLIWYIGDGGICHTNSTEFIKLSTQCFIKEEQEQILLPQLSNFEASLMKADIDKNGIRQYYIYIPHRKEKDFLTYIGKCPFLDYQYKWEVREYKNAIPKKHNDKEQIFCQLYLEGQTYYQIAKHFNIEPNAVKYYLVKNNIYKSTNNSKTKNAVVQYEKDEPINIYISGSEASRKLNISNSGISQVCNGKQKNAGGYIWKRYKDLTIDEKNEIQNKFSKYFN